MSSGNERDEQHIEDLTAPLNGDYIRAQDLCSLIERLGAYERAMGELQSGTEHYEETLDIINTLSIPINEDHHLSIDFFLSEYDSATRRRIVKNIQDSSEEEGFDDYEEWRRSYPLIEGMRNNFIERSVTLYLNTHYRNPEENLINFSENAMVRAHHGLASYEPHSVMMIALRLVILREYALSKLMEDNSRQMYQ